MKDDCPNEAQSQLGVAIHNIFRSDIDQFDLLVAQKVQRHLSILQHVETHFTLLSWLQGESELRIRIEWNYGH